MECVSSSEFSLHPIMMLPLRPTKPAKMRDFSLTDIAENVQLKFQTYLVLEYAYRELNRLQIFLHESIIRPI